MRDGAERTFEAPDPLDAWVTAALADGWSSKPIYDDHEDEDRARRLTKDGFVVQVYRRLPGHPQHPAWAKKPTLKISAWDPRGKWLAVPEVYDFAALRAAAFVCDACGKVATETFHLGFASKACAACLPEYRKKVEFPGWCD